MKISVTVERNHAIVYKFNGKKLSIFYTQEREKNIQTIWHSFNSFIKFIIG